MSIFAVLFALSALFPVHVLSRDLDPRVPVEIFVMSKCPDAAACETAFPVLELLAISNVTVDYIAKYNAFTCMHGDSECTGNMQQLCARHVAQQNEQAWWRFVLGQDATQKAIPTNGKDCAEQSGLDYAQIARCLADGTGERLLKESIGRAASVRVCCTIRVSL